ncbi:hypothetical protein QNI19_24910 [Cytophagaceae bacterium DM2B3-1]|uniref:PKD domain-containing protein n=1 Tax=Xanthocytophaga flava TaxID=3048013 RepID=A0ABT7CR18_9BACT|nr:hypothetical protein [Xanthocytophaga flavus]MDJ1466861.1 hypothetical protein [Xanthocytophaga flavus]MDJ1496202.1 hypothetical protein [Xanthocytophaga flavus]
MDIHCQRLVKTITDSLDWGPVNEWTGKNFSRLNQAILEKTGVNLSESTLRRVLGKVHYPHLPTETTLDALAVYAGYPDWQSFKQAAPTLPDSKPILTKRPSRPIVLGTGVLLAMILLFCVVSYKPFTKKTKIPHAVFSSRPLTHSIPNTVIFNYKVDSSTTPLYIQQSWDAQTKREVSAKGNTFTSIYYKPGFYEARLLMGDQLLRKHPLLIQSDGWLGLIDQRSEPLYLQSNEFVYKDRLEIPVSSYTRRSLRPDVKPYRAELYNVGNFQPVKATKVNFSAMVKGSSISNMGGCRKAIVFLVTNGIPFNIPITAKGCVSTSHLYDGRGLVDGRVHDLSGFGADLSHWVKVDIQTTTNKLEFLVDSQVAYTQDLPSQDLEVVGIAFGFEGGGAVKNIKLSDNKQVIFSMFP